MLSARHAGRVQATSPRSKRRRGSREDLGLHLCLFACGALPWVGYGLGYAWAQTELALGMLLMIPGLVELLRALRTRARARPDVPARLERGRGGSRGRRVPEPRSRVLRAQLGLHQAL